METETSFFGFDNVVPLSIPTNSYSSLFTGRHIETNTPVFMKRFSKTRVDENLMKQIRNEIDLLSRCKNPYIVQYLGYIENETHITIILEEIKGKTLLEFITNSGGLIEFEAQKIFVHFAIALYYLHLYCKIAHRHLKLENIMIPDNPNELLKIIDFGVSKQFFDESENSSDFKPLMSTLCGSFPYCAPEIIKGEKYTKSIDIWSAGVILYTLLTMELPFQAENEMNLAFKIVNEDPIYPTHLTPNAIDLLQKMLTKDPSKRITIENIMLHPWVQNSDYDSDRNLYFIKNPTVSFFRKNLQVSPILDTFILQEIRMKHQSVDLTKLINDMKLNLSSNETITYNILKMKHYSIHLGKEKDRVSRIDLTAFPAANVRQIQPKVKNLGSNSRSSSTPPFIQAVSSESNVDVTSVHPDSFEKGFGIKQQLMSCMNIATSQFEQTKDNVNDENKLNTIKLPPLLSPVSKPTMPEFTPKPCKKTRKMSANILISTILAKSRKI